ncbi:DUF1801 domain-containing protein [Echinicola rosea]|nr:DUF1801 domain-containing protein [Echinicola rosea]
MKIEAKDPDDYLSKVPNDRRNALSTLRKTLLNNLPRGFEETMSYGMIGYVVPHSIYPRGYHCDPRLPLPFMSIANQKNFIALYHCGIYADDQVMKWFINEFPKYSKHKLDMGKSCIRFKKPDAIPFELIGKLVKKISVDHFIELYESRIKNP